MKTSQPTLIFMFFILSFMTGLGQNKVVDSLKIVLKNHQKKYDRAVLCLDESEVISQTIAAKQLRILSKDLKNEGFMVVKDGKEYNEQSNTITLVVPYKIVL